MAKKEAIQKKLVEDANIALADQLDLVSQINDKMSFLVKSQKDKFTQDKNSLDLTKEAYAITKRLNSEYEDSKAIQRDVARNKKLQNDVTRQQLNIEKEIGDEGKKRLQFIENQAKGLENSKKKLAELREKELAGVANAKQQAEALSQQIMSRQKSLETQKANLSYEEQQYGLLKQTQQALANNNALLDKELERVKNLEKQSKGVVTAMANLGKVLDKIGASGVAKVFTDTAEKSKKLIYEASAGGTKSVGAFTKMRIAAMSFGAALKVALGPMALIGMLISGFQKFKQRAEEAKNLMAEMSQQTMDFGRNLGMSSSMANKVAGSAKAIGSAMGMTREQAVSSAEAIYGQIGGVEKLSDKTMKTFMKLNVHGGISAETIGRMYTMSKLTGASASLVAKNIAKQAQESIKALKVNVNMKQVMEGVTKVSNRMLLASGGYSKSITTAVVQAKKLGLEMDQIENIANSLLNIEDSIAAEMEAELLTGKELNLEKAREAALTGNNAKLMEALAEQGITAADYGNMNRIQQESLAKALGMSGEEMAKMLVTQKQNEASNQDLLDTQHKGIDAMTTQASLAESIKNLNESILLANKDGGEAAIRWEETMAKFRTTVEPLLNMIFIPILDTLSFIVEKITHMISGFVKAREAGMGVFDALGQVWSQADGVSKIMMVIAGTIATIRATQIAINIATKAYNVIMGVGNTIMGIKKGIQAAILVAKGKEEAAVAKVMFKESASLTKSIGIAIMKVIGSLAAIPVAGWALGLAAAGVVAGLAAKYMNDGVISPKSGGSGYGDRVLYGPEGAISFNNKDTIVAGTNLFGNDVASGPDAGKAGGGAVVAELQRVSALLQQILGKEGVVMIDGSKVGTTLALSNYKQQ
jgi:hypothetical protein